MASPGDDAYPTPLEAILGPEAPRREAELVAYAGGTSAFSRIMGGLPAGGPLPRRGLASRRRYEASMRQAQRWVRGGRSSDPRELEVARRLATRAVRERRVRRLVTEGAELVGWVLVRENTRRDSPVRWRRIPNSGTWHMVAGRTREMVVRELREPGSGENIFWDWMLGEWGWDPDNEGLVENQAYEVHLPR